MKQCITLIFFTLLAAMGIYVTAQAADVSTGLSLNDVFISGQNGYHAYRIPALLVTKEGTLLAFCEGRKTSISDQGDLDLLLKRSEDGGKSWSGQKIVYEEGGDEKITIGNPCPVEDQDTGTIWLPFCRDNSDVLITYSEDDGKTWAKPKEITKDVKLNDWGWYATGPGVGIQIRRGKHKGRLVIPCDHQEKVKGKWAMFSHVFYSDDHGKNWKLGGTIALDTDECQVVELNKGALMINMRNNWSITDEQKEKGDKRAIAYSYDGGATWSDLSFDPVLIEPICQASFLRYTWPEEGKNRLLFSNPASKNKRIRMTVRLSYDEGKTWPVSKTIYEGSSAYSCLTVLPDKSIGLLFERDNYKMISFVRFNVDWLTGDKR